MKVLFVDQFSEFGGAQIGLVELLDEVVARRWKAMVLAPGNGPLHRACADRGIRSQCLPLTGYANGHKTVRDVLRYGFDCVRAARTIVAAGRQLKPDLIYINGPRTLPAAVLAARALRCRTVFHAHSFPDRRYTSAISKWCIRAGGTRVIAISRFVATPFLHVGAAPPKIVYNGVRDHGFVGRPGPKPACIGILGRISWEKGHLDLIHAARAMAAGGRDLRVVVFGAALFADAAWERKIRDAAAGLPVEFRGWTDDVSAALHEIDILAVPSGPAEGATRVIMEAFSAGTPVVAYPAGGIPELVRHGETGWLTESSGSAHLASALGSLLDDSQLMARLSVQGRREWETHYRVERCRRDVCDFIIESVGGETVVRVPDNNQRQAL